MTDSERVNAGEIRRADSACAAEENVCTTKNEKENQKSLEEGSLLIASMTSAFHMRI